MHENVGFQRVLPTRESKFHEFPLQHKQKAGGVASLRLALISRREVPIVQRIMEVRKPTVDFV
jgi:hypothetical protein